MGSQGMKSSGSEAMLSRSLPIPPTPVITVRHDFPEGKNIKRILVPIDSSAETLQKLPFILKLAEMFGSEVHIVATHYSQLKVHSTDRRELWPTRLQNIYGETQRKSGKGQDCIR
jgi:hypothetical protein